VAVEHKKREVERFANAMYNITFLSSLKHLNMKSNDMLLLNEAG